MLHDEELQIRLNFLDEAEEYLDTIESVLLQLSTIGFDIPQMDAALRAAHTIKGIGAMVDCQILSQLAHRLEDSLKILKVRRDSTVVDTELETLLLAGVDRMRQISLLHRQFQGVEEEWLSQQVYPIFEQLHQRLGELQPGEEASLMSEADGTNMIAVMFETEVAGLLERLESVLSNPELPCLREELEMMAAELGELGQMLELNDFTSLCVCVQQQLAIVSPDEVEILAHQALAAWQQSQAMVMVGQLEKLPTQLDLPPVAGEIGNIEEETTVSENSAVETETTIDVEVNLEVLEEELDNLGTIADINFSELEQAISNLEPPEEILEVAPIATIEVAATSAATTTNNDAMDSTSLNQAQEASENTVRVPVKLLTQLNDLFGELIIQRNVLNSRLGRFEDFIHLFSSRMKNLEQSNHKLQTFCDQINIRNTASFSTSQPSPFITLGQNFNSQLQLPSKSWDTYHTQFDSLELDRYSDLHLLSQDQRETVIQLQEVAGDLKLSLRELKQSTNQLNRTAKELQVNVTQARMRPLSDIVGRFPRAVRDFSLHYGKTAELKIYGSSTLIDRYILEVIKDPLMHLLRNAFDHGIEEPEQRQAMGKPAQGTIEIRAAHRGNQTLISVSDDGAGIDIDKIWERACQMSFGLNPTEVHQISETELLGLIFEPGFSTADEVTALSGRGIGMDVVRTNLEQVRGEIKVDTQPGVGTTFTISVPFTLSVMRVLLVETNGMWLALPTDSISEIISLSSAQFFNSPGQEVIHWENMTIPLIRLDRWLKFRCPRRAIETEAKPTLNEPTVILIRQGNQVSGIHIDRFWGEQEVVVRQVENVINLPPGFTGCTILEDGRVVPLADISKLLEWIANTNLPSPQKIQPWQPLMQTKTEEIWEPVVSISEKNTILVVDDSVNMRRLLTMMLERAGYRVEQAKDGQVAVDKLLGNSLSIQAVICDIEMPRLDGYGVLAEVQSTPQLKNLPIIMLTSRSSDKHRQIANYLGAKAYFSKPYQEQDLLQTLQQLIP